MKLILRKNIWKKDFFCTYILHGNGRNKLWFCTLDFESALRHASSKCWGPQSSARLNPRCLNQNFQQIMGCLCTKPFLAGFKTSKNKIFGKKTLLSISRRICLDMYFQKSLLPLVELIHFSLIRTKRRKENNCNVFCVKHQPTMKMMSPRVKCFMTSLYNRNMIFLYHSKGVWMFVFFPTILGKILTKSRPSAYCWKHFQQLIS